MYLEQSVKLPRNELLNEYSVPASGHHRVLLIDVVFNVTRGRLMGLTGPAGLLLRGASPHAPPPAPNVLRLPLAWPPAEPRLVLRIAALDEYLEPVKVIVRGPELEARAVYAFLPCTEEYDLYGPGSPDWEDVSNSITPASYLDALDLALAAPSAPGDPPLAYREFFAEMDRKTNFVLLDELVTRGDIHVDDADQRKLAIESIGNELRTRVQTRCQGLNGTNYPSLAERVFDHLESKCERISGLLLEVVDAHVPNLPDFEEAFNLFSNGDLRLQLPNLAVTTQPSSGFYFLFGEFALMASQYGFDQPRWSDLANVMVRTQRIFTRVYAPMDKAGATFLSYRSWNYECYGERYSTAEMDQLRVDFVDKDLALEAARHAHDEMPGLLTP